jgi:hypothetical protein
MKVALPSIVFALLETAAIAGLRNHPNDAPAPVDVQIVSLGDNGNQQQGKTRLGKPPDPPAQVQSFTIASIGSQQQGKSQGKKKNDNHLPSHLQNNNFYDTSIVGGTQSNVGEFPYFGKF